MRIIILSYFCYLSLIYTSPTILKCHVNKSSPQEAQPSFIYLSPLISTLAKINIEDCMFLRFETI